MIKKKTRSVHPAGLCSQKQKVVHVRNSISTPPPHYPHLFLSFFSFLFFSFSLMKPSVIRLVLLVCVLNAITALTTPIPFGAESSNVKIRGNTIETRDVEVPAETMYYSRNIMIEAREPTPVDLPAAAPATSNLQRRNPVGAVVQVGKMIAQVIVKIKEAFAADKKV